MEQRPLVNSLRFQLDMRPGASDLPYQGTLKHRICEKVVHVKGLELLTCRGSLCIRFTTLFTIAFAAAAT